MTKDSFLFVIFCAQLFCCNLVQANPCAGRGTMVIFVNGVFNKEQDADSGLIKLDKLTRPPLSDIPNLRYDLAWVEGHSKLLQLAQATVQRGVSRSGRERSRSPRGRSWTRAIRMTSPGSCSPEALALRPESRSSSAPSGRLRLGSSGRFTSLRGRRSPRSKRRWSFWTHPAPNEARWHAGKVDETSTSPANES